MRLLGAAMLVAACGAFGYSLVAAEKRRCRLLGALISSLEILRGEISTRLTPLPDCARLLAETGPAGCRGFYADLYAALGALGEIEFPAIWDACLDALDVPERAREALSDLGRSLGRYTAAEQRAALERCLESLWQIERAEQENARKTARVRLGLPVCAGLLLAVILY